MNCDVLRNKRKNNLNRCVFLGLSYYQIDERNRLIQQHKNLDLL